MIVEPVVAFFVAIGVAALAPTILVNVLERL